eukprot:scaffold15929_cov159-Ochromonas_danica.AAC.9
MSPNWSRRLVTSCLSEEDRREGPRGLNTLEKRVTSELLAQSQSRLRRTSTKRKAKAFISFYDAIV